MVDHKVQAKEAKMNSCNFIGRITRDPDVRYFNGENPICIARFSMAVDREGKRDGGQAADFPTFKALGKRGEFVEKYLKKGMKMGIKARAETGSYDKNGNKVYYTEFVCEGFTFCENKASSEGGNGAGDGFMDIPEGSDEGLPFN